MRYRHQDSYDEEDDVNTAADAEKSLLSTIETIIPAKLPSSTTTQTVGLTESPAIISETAHLQLEPVQIANIGTEDISSYSVDYESSYLSPNIHYGNCALMKSTFFNPEITDRDICSREFFELSDYVSNGSPRENEELVLASDICDDFDKVEPINFSKGVILDETTIDISHTLLKDTSNIIADIAAFKGKSFRVGWTKEQTFLCLEKGELLNQPFHHRITFKKLINTNENSFSCLEKHLESQFNNSASVVERKNEIPYCFSCFGNDKLKEHGRITANLSKNNYEKQIWDLLDVLFGLEDNEVCKIKIDKIRKQKLSKWIESVIESSVENEVNFNRNNISQILSYLSGNKIDKAAELALKSGNFNLSLLLSQTPIRTSAQIALKNQITIWEQTDCLEFVDETILKIYLLLSGNIEMNMKDKTLLVYEGSDWIRIFALYFWFVAKKQQPLSDAVLLYEKMFEINKKVLSPISSYASRLGDIYDLRFHLLKYYSDNTHPISDLLNTFTYTNDPLDYRLGWFLFQTLHSLNQEVTSKRIRNHMHISFASQLEQMGLWHWAVYILTYIDNNNLKKELIIDLLGRHVQIRSEETTEYKEREIMIIKKFKICPNWIENQKAIKAEQMHDNKDAIYYWLYSKNWQKYFDLVMEYIIPEQLLSHNYDYVIELLAPLLKHKNVFPDWEDTGGLIFDFAKLRIQYNNILTVNNPELIEPHLNRFRSSVININTRFQNFKPKTYMQDICLVEIAQNVGIMLRKLLFILDGQSFRMLMHTATNAQNIAMASDYLKQELNNILSDFVNRNQSRVT